MPTEKPKVEYFADKLFIWKIEGNVMTMQAIRPEAFKSCRDVEDVKKVLKTWRKDWEEEGIKRAKERGITIIEYWVHEDYLNMIKQYHKEHGRKFEVVRKEDGQYFCRLILG